MGERILVVDDNPVSAEMLCKFLEKHNIKTVVCEDRKECLAEVARGSVAIVFIEVVMSGSISGLERSEQERKMGRPCDNDNQRLDKKENGQSERQRQVPCFLC